MIAKLERAKRAGNAAKVRVITAETMALRDLVFRYDPTRGRGGSSSKASRESRDSDLSGGDGDAASADRRGMCVRV